MVVIKSESTGAIYHWCRGCRDHRLHYFTDHEDSYVFHPILLKSSLDVRIAAAGAQYVGCIFAAAGIYTGNALLLRCEQSTDSFDKADESSSWPGENVSAQTKRAVAVAMQITIGDIGAIAGYAKSCLILCVICR